MGMYPKPAPKTPIEKTGQCVKATDLFVIVKYFLLAFTLPYPAPLLVPVASLSSTVKNQNQFRGKKKFLSIKTLYSPPESSLFPHPSLSISLPSE